MKPSLLMRHFETKHGDLKHKLLEYFERKLSDLSASKGQIMPFSGVNMKAVEASYKVSLRIANAGKPHKSPCCCQQLKIWPVQLWERK
jgi:hypothetical protein